MSGDHTKTTFSDKFAVFRFVTAIFTNSVDVPLCNLIYWWWVFLMKVSLYFQFGKCHQGWINLALLSTLDNLLSIHGILYDRPNDFYRWKVFARVFVSCNPNIMRIVNWTNPNEIIRNVSLDKDQSFRGNVNTIGIWYIFVSLECNKKGKHSVWH